MTIEKAMLKDSGDWQVLVGTGKSLATFKKKEYIHPVLVNGKYLQRNWYQCSYKKSKAGLFLNVFLSPILSITVSNDHKMVRQHHLPPGDDLKLLHSSPSSISFCGLDIPFTSDKLHVTFPPDPFFEDIVR